MVFIKKETDEILINDAYKSLVITVQSLVGQSNIDEVFAAWLLPNENIGLNLSEAAQDSVSRSGASRTYQDIAILGYCADRGMVDESIRSALINGLKWQSGRSIFVNGIPTGINQDPIALLGIALGTRIIADPDLTDTISHWIKEFIYNSYSARGTENWHKCLIAATQRVLGFEPEISLPNEDSIIDVKIALASKGLFSLNNDESDAQALYYLKHPSSTNVEPIRAAFSLAAYIAISGRDNKINKSVISTNEGGMQTLQKKIKILFLGASPINENRLRLDAEVREIDNKLQMSRNRDSFILETKWAVRVSDLQGHLLRYSPDIVHFSGHGSEANEIILENNVGESHAVSAKTLGKLFSVLKDNIKCVVLNACYSQGQAEAIAEHIDCVIGMSSSIMDDSAISFAASFYQALAYGKSVNDSYQLGRIQIDMENLDEGDIPQLLCKKLNANQIHFV
jgi:hypothetical protein